MCCCEMRTNFLWHIPGSKIQNLKNYVKVFGLMDKECIMEMNVPGWFIKFPNMITKSNGIGIKNCKTHKSRNIIGKRHSYYHWIESSRQCLNSQLVAKFIVFYLFCIL